MTRNWKKLSELQKTGSDFLLQIFASPSIKQRHASQIYSWDRHLITHRCSYCHKNLRPNTQEATDTEQISHGICRDCLETVMAGQGQSVAEFLCQLEVPIVVVDQYGQPVWDNRTAAPRTAKPDQALARILDSEVFGCSCEEGLKDTNLANSLSCTLQKTTSDTYYTGISHRRVPASADLDSLAGIDTMRYLITTQKQHNRVLLKIEERKEFD